MFPLVFIYRSPSSTDAKENESGYNSKSMTDNFAKLKSMGGGLFGSTTATEVPASCTNVDRCAAIIEDDEVEYDDDLL